MSVPFLGPTRPLPSRKEVFLGYLDYFRASVVDRVLSLTPAAQRQCAVPSGWTPLSLVRHLTHVERRWLEWGFEGRAVDDPWGDQRDGRWFVGEDEDGTEVVHALEERGARTREIVTAHELDEVGRPGPRWDGAEPPTLERVLFHLLQEYARHLGHLDVVSELAGGKVGE